jgi:hypothetical protein
MMATKAKKPAAPEAEKYPRKVITGTRIECWQWSKAYFSYAAGTDSQIP